jgi:hypothetical protein
LDPYQIDSVNDGLSLGPDSCPAQCPDSCPMSIRGSYVTNKHGLSYPVVIPLSSCHMTVQCHMTNLSYDTTLKMSYDRTLKMSYDTCHMTFCHTSCSCQMTLRSLIGGDPRLRGESGRKMSRAIPRRDGAVNMMG